jgi:hypothetical protein
MTDYARLVYVCRNGHTGEHDYSRVAPLPVSFDDFWAACPVCGMKQAPVHQYRTFTPEEARALLDELTQHRDSAAIPITGMRLGTHHRDGGVDLVVGLRIGSSWHDIIRAPYIDGGVLGHCVFPLGIRESIESGQPR